MGGAVFGATLDNTLKNEHYCSNNEQTKTKFEKGSFVRPGEFIDKNVVANKLCYVESIEIFHSSYLFVRPVQIFQVPREKGFSLEHRFFSIDPGDNIKLKTVKRIFFKNWERVKSTNSVNLLQTFLVLQRIA